MVHQPDHGTQALNVLEQLIKLGVSCIIVDSVAALTTKEELEGSLGDAQVAEQARLMSRALRRLTTEAGKRKTTVFWTNQMRELIGVTYGDKTTTPAGRALKHYASVRCSIRRISTEKETIDGEEVAIASETQVDVKKNKTAPPFRRAKFYIVYGRGIDPIISTFDAALKYGVLTKRGSWFSFGSDNLEQGRYKSIALLQEDTELYDRVKEELDEAMKTKTPVVVEDAKPKIKKPSTRKKKESDDGQVEVTNV
jgi:recombination protein RecA